jgi:hypothetical protein
VTADRRRWSVPPLALVLWVLLAGVVTDDVLEGRTEAITRGEGTLSSGAPSAVQAPSTTTGGSAPTTTVLTGGTTSPAQIGQPVTAATPPASTPPPKQLGVTAAPITGLTLEAADAPARQWVQLTIANPNSSAVSVLRVSAVVLSVRHLDGTPASRCPLTSLQVTPLSFPLGVATISSRGTGSLHVPVKLVDQPTVNQDDCKRVVFDVRYDINAGQQS